MYFVIRRWRDILRIWINFYNRYWINFSPKNTIVFFLSLFRSFYRASVTLYSLSSNPRFSFFKTPVFSAYLSVWIKFDRVQFIIWISLNWVHIKQVCTDGRIKGRRFHWGQSWWRKIHKSGLSKECKSDSERSRYIKYFFGFPFLNGNDVVECFTEDLMAMKPRNGKTNLQFCRLHLK